MAVGRSQDRNLRPKQTSDFSEDGESDALQNLDEEDFSDSVVDEEGELQRESLSGSSDLSESDESGAALGGEDVHDEVANVSFGALLQAQDALSRKRKRGSDTTAEQDAKLDAVRARLRDIRSEKENEKSSAKSKHSIESRLNPPPRKGTGAQDGNAVDNKHSSCVKSPAEANYASGSDSDSAPSEEEAPTKSRTSKHAPATQSSKHQVTRKRIVIDVPKRVSRDPRFDALQQNSVHSGNSEKAYDFLRDYEKAEIAELKSAIKLARSEDDKETMKRKLVSMENRIKSKEAQERQQEVLRRHRKEEREKVEQGKKPFFLKRKDVKERALAEKFSGMKKKDQQKLIDKRKKRESQKEMKRMPAARRVAG